MNAIETQGEAIHFYRADVEAAKQQAAAIIGARIDAMKAGDVYAIAKKFLPTMVRMKPTMSKAKNKAAMTDPKINLEAAAAEIGATLPAEVKRALQADMDGRLVDAVQDDGVTKPQVQAQVQQSQPPATGDIAAPYTLPAGSIADDWRDDQQRYPEHPNYTPTPRQQRLILEVKKSLESGAFYASDVYAMVAKALGVSEEVLASNRTGVQRGDFGYDVYLARKFVEAQAQEAELQKIRAELKNLQTGDKLGTLIFSDGKQTRAVEVVRITQEGRCATFKGKRGAKTYEIEAAVHAVKWAIERAYKNGKRKDSYEEFIAGLNACVEMPEPTAPLEAHPEESPGANASQNGGGVGDAARSILEFIKARKVAEAHKEFARHIQILEMDCKGVRLQLSAPEFADAVSFATCRQEIDQQITSLLVSEKQEANRIAGRVAGNLTAIDSVPEYAQLFGDRQELAHMESGALEAEMERRVVEFLNSTPPNKIIDTPALPVAEVQAMPPASPAFVALMESARIARHLAREAIAKAKENSKPAPPKAEPVAPEQPKNIRFMRHYVTDGTHKAKCDYSANTLIDGRNVVTIYATTYRRDLRPIFGDATRNDTGTMTDYFCKDSVNIVEGDPLYPAALERVRINEAKRQQRREKREAKNGSRH